jgi:hypothetical protein
MSLNINQCLDYLDACVTVHVVGIYLEASMEDHFVQLHRIHTVLAVVVSDETADWSLYTNPTEC